MSRSIVAAAVAAVMVGGLVSAAASGQQQQPSRDDGARPVRPGPGFGFARAPELRAQGHGEVSAKPDLAVVALGATAQAKSAVDAQTKVNDAMRAVVEKVKAAGVAAEKVQTSRLELQPVYESRPNREGQMELVGYRATSGVRVELSDLAKIGDVVDAALGAGANTFEGVYFRLKDDIGARKDALKQAVVEAREKADAMADAAGVRLGSVASIEEGGAAPGYPVPMMRGAAVMAAQGSGTPVSPGEVKVEADVTVVYRIVPEFRGDDGGGGDRGRRSGE